MIAYENKYYNVYKKDFKTGEYVFQEKKSFIKDWFKDANIRTYNKIDFLPMQTAPDNVYNTFTGYEAQKLEPIEGIDNEALFKSKIFEHCRKINGNDEKVLNYFLFWLSKKLKQPWISTTTALLQQSPQGAGKDTLWDWIGNDIFGSKYYYNEDDIDNVYGRFNTLTSQKIIGVLNEANGADTFKIIDKIKNSITKKQNFIEYKGQTGYYETNHIGSVYLTNNLNAVSIPADDRRWCAVSCDSSVCNVRKYHNALRAEIKSKKYNRAFYDYLMSLDSENYDFTNNRPTHTSLYKNMQESNIPLIAKFLYYDVIIPNYKEEEKMVEVETFNENGIKRITKINELVRGNKRSYDTFTYKSTDFLTLYNTFLKNGNYKFDSNSTNFGTTLNTFKEDGITKAKSRESNNYTINYLQLETHLKSKYFKDFIDDDANTDDDADDDVAEINAEVKITKTEQKLKYDINYSNNKDIMIVVKKQIINNSDSDDDDDYDVQPKHKSEFN
jgi:hypothetical protein